MNPKTRGTLFSLLKSFGCVTITTVVMYLITLISKNPFNLQDSLFAGGMLCLLYALFGFVTNIGLFDLTTFSFKKFSQSFKKKQLIEEEERLTTYRDYLDKKKSKPIHTQLILISVVFILISVLM